MAIRRNGAQKRVSTIASLPMPTKGINDIDALASTPDGYCIYLRDIFPSNQGFQLSYGDKEWATGLGSSLKSLVRYNALDGTQQFFGVTDFGIYDITASTDTPTKVATLSSGDVQYTQMTNTSGAYLVLTNGVDPFLVFNGSTWIVATQVATPAGPGQVNGADPSTLFDVHLYKNRLWFAQRDSLTSYYLETDAVAGTLTPFYLGGIFSRGGQLSEINDWSLNSGSGSGSGVSAFLIFRTSAGEVAIYSGADPEDAANWHMDAMLFVAPPVGKKASCEYGGDVLLMTRAGLIPLSKVLQGAATSSLYEDSLSKNISRTLNRIVSQVNFSNDWELWNLPSMQALAIVIPSNDNKAAAQYLMNSQTGAWCEFSLDATCLGVYENEIYYGTAAGTVARYSKEFGRRGVKLDGTGGAPITGTFLSAFSYFGDPTTLKHFKLVRPVVQSAIEPSLLVSMASDFQITDVSSFSAPTLSDATLALWDSATWDTSKWASSSQIFRPWTSVIGIGYSGALRMEITNITASSLIAWELVFETGGAI